MNVMHFIQLPLPSLKLADVRTFVDKVKFMLIAIDPGELKDANLMYNWLWEKFKNWTHIAGKFRRFVNRG